jgi:glucose-6-phosphate 1-dehydrogenase
MTMKIIPVQPFDLVIFGGTGDLARRKLLPGLFRRDLAGQLPREARIIAAARRPMQSEEFQSKAEVWLREFVSTEELSEPDLARFLGRLQYLAVDADSSEGWEGLAETLRAGGERIRAFYLAVGPRFFGPICERLGACGAATPDSRIVVEKPLGHDLASARDLNARIAAVFDEAHVYRIDHYLGKETVQNLMALRFANALFEPLWNARHVDHVQITVAENLGLDGRGEYYDRTGALRDMVQNHLLQLLCLTAMEPPGRFEPDLVRDEKVKVLRALAPIGPANVTQTTVRGQHVARNGIPGYLDDVGVASSATESFVALKANVENWRWSGTPFYLRTGKRLRARMSEIAIVFKDAPHSIFPASAGAVHGNVLAIRLQPDEGVTLRMTIKDPGPGGMRLRGAALDMSFANTLGEKVVIPDAYERLVLDVIRGDQTLFMRRDEVEAAWSWIDPILAAWEDQTDGTRPYDPGGSGPEDALLLMHREGRRWRDITG